MFFQNRHILKLSAAGHLSIATCKRSNTAQSEGKINTGLIIGILRGYTETVQQRQTVSAGVVIDSGYETERDYSNSFNTCMDNQASDKTSLRNPP